jgi:hypothetical protein
MRWFNRRKTANRPVPRLHLDDFQALIDATPWHARRRLDQEVRRSTWAEPAWFEGWHAVQVEHVHNIVAASPEPALAAAALSMHPKGYVREQAVQILAGSPPGVALPFLEVRLTDWVQEVGDAAQAAIEPMVVVENTDDLLRLAPLIDQMAAGRSRSFDRPEAVLDRIATLVDSGQLGSTLSTGDAPTRRWCARLLVARGASAAWLDAALGQADVVTASIIGNGAARERPDDEAVLNQLLTSVSGSLRALALFHLQERGGDRATSASHTALTDRSPLTRDLARRYLAAAGIDVRQRYLQLVAEDPRAFESFADLATRTDLALVEQFLHHDQPRLRARATTAYARLNPSAALPVLLDKLDDPSPMVIRTSGRSLANLPLPPRRSSSCGTRCAGRPTR